jgi:hypothetical protein
MPIDPQLRRFLEHLYEALRDASRPNCERTALVRQLGELLRETKPERPAPRL